MSEETAQNRRVELIILPRSAVQAPQGEAPDPAPTPIGPVLDAFTSAEAAYFFSDAGDTTPPADFTDMAYDGQCNLADFGYASDTGDFLA
ncbi:hypothetical protein [Acuticoccus sp. I52.16.1]|uniref:hypothetical protein n=1 Tax=Acuticoccus sp. I52.16.1 TaxID=2928472 RepID=UPI001FD37D4E|nr:hypothetical protein [Acuticoccus sp. I52.16.1]UOM33731.1 hypothetical protein MRB58_18100 [Acuticoccus sp. I52.16.1]